MENAEEGRQGDGKGDGYRAADSGPKPTYDSPQTLAPGKRRGGGEEG